MTPRRRFLQNLALFGVGAQTLLRTGSVNAAVVEADAARAAEWPKMAYRVLGRTGHKSSRLVYGCGAALSRQPADRYLNLAFEHGVNTYDVGYSEYYGAAQRNLATFSAAHRDDIFLISKAPARIRETSIDEVSPQEAKFAANLWTNWMDQSLKELRQEYVDAYYVMGTKSPAILKSEEILSAFTKAKEQGKVKHLGVSTHENAAAVLRAAIDAELYDLAMIAITPAGWYDWASKQTLAGSGSMTDIRPLLDEAREKGVGLVGMKAGRMLAGQRWGGRGDETAFDSFYNEEMLKAELTAFQRSYAFVLAHGLDVVNADIQNINILEENFIAASVAEKYV